MSKTIKFFLMSFLSLFLISGKVLAASDDGRGADGVLIFPKKFAMFCDIGSSDIWVDGTVKQCLDKILSLKKASGVQFQEYSSFFNEAYHQVNKEYLEKTLKAKSKSGDIEDEIENSIKDCAQEDEDTLKVHQCRNRNLTSLGSQQIVDIIDVYSSLSVLRAMNYYRVNEFSSAAAEIEE